MDVGTRVIVPLAINAPVGNQRVESKHGEITEMGPGELCTVKLDNGFSALWVLDQLVDEQTVHDALGEFCNDPACGACASEAPVLSHEEQRYNA